ncbi:helix-turn-helix domain containing protein [Sphingomonas sp. BLCC-B65]|nr:helix-turn-helix domain containing protein [Sphingomonas sp. BLCC-B65]
MDAAAGVFARLGYDRARMADIIEASGLSKGSVYFHFDSKEALAVAVLEDRHDRWITDIERLLRETPAGSARLRSLLPAMLTLHRDDPDAWVISRLTQNLAAVASTRDLAAKVTRRWIDLVADLIGEARTGAYSEAEPGAEALATVIVGAFDGLKLTVDVVAAGDHAAAERMLADGGLLLEGMLFKTLGLAAT